MVQESDNQEYLDFDKFDNTLSRLESMPSSQRYFEKLFEDGGIILEEMGIKNRKLFGDHRWLVIQEIEEDEPEIKRAWGISYHRPLMGVSDSMLISRLSSEEEKFIELERVRGHLTRKNEGEYDFMTRLIKGVSNAQIIQGLTKFQPYRLKMGNNPDDLKLIYEY